MRGASFVAAPSPANAQAGKTTLLNHILSHRSNLRIAACVRIKNEGIYIREWLEFHLMVGIEHFYIWDDSSTDATREELAPYVERGVVTLHTKVDHSHDAEHGQNGHRDMCLACAEQMQRAQPRGARCVVCRALIERVVPAGATAAFRPAA